jgi:CheY-like chemotaxis protein
MMSDETLLHGKFVLARECRAMTDLRQNSAQDGQPSANDRVGKFCASHRILVVDDNRDAAESMRILLKLMGAEVRAAYDGFEALKVAADFRPQAVLLDIGMPKLHGYDTARRFRGEEWGKDIVLVALTGWCRDEDRRRSLEAGFNAHLTKPVQAGELRQSLERLLAQAPPSA